MIATLNEIISLLEAEIPANPNNPANIRQRERLEGELVRYFDRLEQAFPYTAIERIYNRYVKED